MHTKQKYITIKVYIDQSEEKLSGTKSCIFPEGVGSVLANSVFVVIL